MRVCHLYFMTADGGGADLKVQVIDSIAQAVGNTPLVRLSRLGLGLRHNLLAKCEYLNPCGSVKDRIAFYLLQQAKQSGRLRPGQPVIEGTGGNTGIGLAMACKLAGHQLTCVMTEKVNKEKQRLMRQFGVEVVVVAGGKAISDPTHFINQARSLAVQRDAWFVDQFANADNIQAHYTTTGPEIWAQTEGGVDALVAGIGTGGTLCGAGKFLKERKPGVKLILADPVGSTILDVHRGVIGNAGPYIVEGIGGDFIPSIVDMNEIDQVVKVNDDDSIKITQRLLDEEAIFVGGSSGCIVAAAVQYCQETAGTGQNVVAILPSAGHLYLSTIFDDAWLTARETAKKGVKGDSLFCLFVCLFALLREESAVD